MREFNLQDQFLGDAGKCAPPEPIVKYSRESQFSAYALRLWYPVLLFLPAPRLPSLALDYRCPFPPRRELTDFYLASTEDTEQVALAEPRLANYANTHTYFS